MITVRKAGERGVADFGWLNSRHTFSFGNYRDPKHMGFGPLRVINDDRVAGGAGFGTHGHADMEIISYVLEGQLAHKDSLGNGSVIVPGDVQRMTAGRGIEHGEFNGSKTDAVHFLQVWIVPETKGLQPSYEQKTFADLSGGFRLIGSRDGRSGSVIIHQNVDLYAAKLGEKGHASATLAPGRIAWLHVAEGSVEFAGNTLEAGDGVAIRDEAAITVTAPAAAHILLCDMGA